jgi:transcription elongation GreA/GreB family factor
MTKASRTIKDRLFMHCRRTIDERIEACRRAIIDAQQSANQETKSSSGDKYETGRAMAQLEIEKNSGQLNEAIKLKMMLEQIPVDHSYVTAQPGSMVTTDRGTFFIAIGLGKVEVDNSSYYVIAPFSPLGLAMAGSKAGDAVTFRDQTYVIRELI